MKSLKINNLSAISFLKKEKLLKDRVKKLTKRFEKNAKKLKRYLDIIDYGYNYNKMNEIDIEEEFFLIKEENEKISKEINKIKSISNIEYYKLTN